MVVFTQVLSRFGELSTKELASFLSKNNYNGKQ
jgi:hypothetical protein